MKSFHEELRQTPEIIVKVLQETPEYLYESAERVVFCGCGTSYYIGGQIAKLCLKQGKKAAAVDAVELAEGVFPVLEGDLFVFISRSGTSQETVFAMRRVKEAKAQTCYLGCRKGSILYEECDRKIVLEYAEEENILESYSYYAQFLIGCMICGLPLGEQLPERMEEAIKTADKDYEEYIADKKIQRIICLGAPFYQPFLREMMLKNGEITQLPTEAWGCLEFRHGPRSWANSETLIEFITGDFSRVWDEKVAEELVSYGCPVLMLSEEKLEGARVPGLNAEKSSVDEILLCGIYITEIASRIGQARNTCPEKLKHVVHNVGAL